jgi:hypothetical protein
VSVPSLAAWLIRGRGTSSVSARSHTELPSCGVGEHTWTGGPELELKVPEIVEM